MLDANEAKVLEQIRPGDVVLDVGGWARCFNRANFVLDKFPYETRGRRYQEALDLGPQGGEVEHFSSETWITRDLCDREPWPFADKSLDYCICSHTLEDLRDPLWVCSEMIRVARRGYIEVPSILFELTRGREPGVPVGLSHHLWIVEKRAEKLIFSPKTHNLHGDRRLSLPAAFGASLPANRQVTWLFWEEGFAFEEGWLSREFLEAVIASQGPFSEPEVTEQGPHADRLELELTLARKQISRLRAHLKAERARQASPIDETSLNCASLEPMGFPEANHRSATPMTSFSQNREDVLLNRLFPLEHTGFYIDIGACHPTIDSVTRHFYELGWSGINVEPVREAHEALCRERPRDRNLALAISDREGTMTLHEPATSIGMSTLSAPFAAGLRAHGFEYIERPVEVTTLARLCAEHAPEGTIDLLKIDVEGHEEAVIRGGDWRRWRPRVVVVEATVAPERWEPVLLGADYLLAASDGINRYYVRFEDRQLAARLIDPVSVLDNYTACDLLAGDWARVEETEAQLAGTQEGFAKARELLWEARTRLDMEICLREQIEQQIDTLQTQVEELQARLSPIEGLGPGTIQLARWLGRIAKAHPRVKAMFKQVVRVA